MNKTLVLCLISLGFAGTANAVITDHGDYTHDSDSGLYWLDVTKTQGLSYNEVLQRLQPGGPLEGWRYAIHTELEDLILKFGIPAQGNSCYVGSFSQPIAYCDDVDAAYAENLEDMIRTLGDTLAAQTNPNPLSPDVAPDGAGETYGLILHSTGSCTSGNPRGIGWLEDGELVYGRSTDPYSDATDEIRSIYCGSGGPRASTAYAQYGSYLVRTDEPTLPIVVDLDPLPLPELPPGGQLLFNNLAPEDLDLHIECEHPVYATGPCSYSSTSFSAYTTDGPYPYTGSFGLWLKDDFDAQATPWVRINSFDFTPAQYSCAMDNQIYHSGTRLAVEDLSLYEGGNGLCRVTVDNDFAYLPPLMIGAIELERYIPGSGIDYSDASGGVWWGYSIDNVVLDFLPPNMEIEFDPYRNNEIEPTEAYFATVDIFTTSVADGDAFDFDTSQVDTSTLALGPGMAPNVAANPIVSDRDGDGDMDLTVGFRIENTGMGCLDTQISLTGNTLSGDPIFGRTNVTPVNCAKVVEMDVDPFNDPNEVRPDDSYVVLVGVKTTSKADGDAEDVDALQIDPATLSFGPSGAGSAQAPIFSDLDGDSDTDAIFGFQVQDTGIACGDTEVTLDGQQYDGYPLTGIDTIETVDCTETSCHP